MLVPCIDLQSGQSVQLVHGRRRELAISDVFGLLEKFRRYKWLHIIDLDAARNKPPNTKLARALCKTARTKYKLKVRIGGGIRTIARATNATKTGANQIIIGSAAFSAGKVNAPFLRRLTKKVPRRTSLIEMDNAKGRIVTRRWRRKV